MNQGPLLECDSCVISEITWKRNWDNGNGVELECSNCGNTVVICLEDDKLHDRPAYHKGEFKTPSTPDRINRPRIR